MNKILYEKAIALLKNKENCSISYIQRKLCVGYNSASDIVKKLEKEKIVSSPNRDGLRKNLSYIS